MGKKSISENNKSKLAIGCVITIGICMRIVMAILHFTHADDIGEINQLINGKYIGLTYKEMLDWDWTYAPFQPLFTALMVNKNFSQQWNLFVGRLPSLLCGIVAMLLVLFLCDKIIDGIQDKWKIIFPLVLISFSWENIIYSAQAEPYEILVVFILTTILLIKDRFYESWKKALIALGILTIGCYSHYQFFVVVFAMYVAVFLANIRNKGNEVRIICVGVGNLLFSLPLLIQMQKKNMFGRSINWNAGKSGQFSFVLPQESFFEKLRYSITFFVNNTFSIIRYFTVPNLNDIIAGIITILIVMIVLLGIWSVNKKEKELALYVDILLIIVFAMICKGSLSYGPSRHMLIVFPIIIIAVAYGMDSLNLQVTRIGCKILTLTLSILFVFSIPDEVAQRLNYINQPYIQEIIDSYEPDVIYTYDWVCDLYAMDFIGYENESLIHGPNPGLIKKTYSEDSSRLRVLIISKSTDIDTFLGLNVDDQTRKLFESKLENLGYEWFADCFPDYKIIYKKEIHSDAEVEYASEFYLNYPNGLYAYILQAEKN